ncbi:MAG TPA: hypothetical protein VJP87_05005, partial [Candidatus Acidoferrales bacterium]|nr:hypothetical protein [Candidatus Acidoferrales bacterium]
FDKLRTGRASPEPGSSSFSSSFRRKPESSSISIQTPHRGDPESSSSSSDDADESAVLQQWLDLETKRAELKKRIKQADATLDQAAYAKYADLTEADIKTLVVADKWLAALGRAIEVETERAGQQLTQRVKELAERYAAPLPQLETRVAELQAKVDAHLHKMGFAWK